MKLKKTNYGNWGIILLVLLTLACKNDKKQEEQTESNQKEDHLIEVVTRSMDFQTVDTVRSGWNTFSYKNLSGEVHFFILDKLPSDTITDADITNHLMPVFDDGMKYLIEGKADSAMTAFGKIPAWFNDVKRFGGTGLISPGETAISSVNLTPGKYLMECYVKGTNGEFHSSHGMWKFITVIDEPTNFSPVEADHTISISSTDGYVFDAQPKPGKNRFKVNFIDQVPYEHFSGHDVNLIKYDSTANIDSLVHWMNWMNPTGLMTPSPSGFTFLGGMNNCEAGETGYFEVDLESGNYLLISETPKADEKGMVKTFVVNDN
ncbi:hypothetical protein FK178_06355 [Antarcticibacterium arcticum]|uniref:Uncharacterized protein n=1 Tax=Antarcticibacterium arcticum TaxID=2585771 RepID=A0A5B8YL54_9FLAO|nr:hypothetical protein [Antarcticibacterium arcticum]QED37363.1 hypothetical protein FK178_06355 [Antarcticibacterium arcticum]